MRIVQRQIDVAVRRAAGRVTLEFPASDVTLITLERVDSVAPDAAKLQEYTGSYWSPELDIRYEVGTENGHLIVRRRLMTTLTLNPTYADAFTGGGNWVFTRDTNARINGVLYSSGRVRRLRFERMK